MTTGSPPSITATTELVVPRSIPMILLMSFFFAGTLPCERFYSYDSQVSIKVESPIINTYFQLEGGFHRFSYCCRPWAYTGQRQ